MNFDFRVHQLLLEPAAPDPWQVVARSEGVSDLLVTKCGRLLTEAGYPFDRDVLFAHVLDTRHVAIVRVTQHRPAYFQIWHAATYARLGDPFRLADLIPPDRPQSGELPTREVEPAGLPRPTVADLLNSLGATDMPLVLGATQALLDGVRVRFGPGEATESTLRLIWDLLPDSTRHRLWPHTAANGRTDDHYDACLTSEPATPSPGVLSAEQCRDYPEGRYELALQTALERGDGATVAALFARRSSAETLRIAAGTLAVTLVGALVVRLVAVG